MPRRFDIGIQRKTNKHVFCPKMWEKIEFWTSIKYQK